MSLAKPRRHAEAARSKVRAGLDPIKERERERRDSARNLHLLNDIAADCFESRKAELKGDGAAGRWFSPLELHVLPRLGKMPVADIDQTDIRDCLAPIWHSKAETARKAITRLALCLKHAAALGLTVDIGNFLAHLLGLRRTGDLAAMAFRVPFGGALSGWQVRHGTGQRPSPIGKGGDHGQAVGQVMDPQ